MIPPFYYLNEFTPTLRFEIDSFKIKSIDMPSFLLSFDVQGLRPSQKINATLYFTYKDTLVRSSYNIGKEHKVYHSETSIGRQLIEEYFWVYPY